MTLFWCEIHDASAPHERAHCWYAVAKMNDGSGWGAGGCRVIERRLVALDGIDVEALRDALDTDISVTNRHDAYGSPYAVADMIADDAWIVWGFARQVLDALDGGQIHNSTCMEGPNHPGECRP